jgi:hypothetical protein
VRNALCSVTAGRLSARETLHRGRKCHRRIRIPILLFARAAFIVWIGALVDMVKVPDDPMCDRKLAAPSARDRVHRLAVDRRRVRLAASGGGASQFRGTDMDMMESLFVVFLLFFIANWSS